MTSLSAKVYGGSATLFVGLGAVFAVRMTAGGDPALAAPSVAQAAPASAVLVRQVVVTRHVNVDGLSAAELRRRGIREVVIEQPKAAGGRPSVVTAAASGVPADAAPSSTQASTPSGGDPAPAAAPESGAGTAAPAPSSAAPTTYAPVPQAPAESAPVPEPVAGTSPEQASAPAPVVTRTS